MRRLTAEEALRCILEEVDEHIDVEDGETSEANPSGARPNLAMRVAMIAKAGLGE